MMIYKQVFLSFEGNEHSLKGHKIFVSCSVPLKSQSSTVSIAWCSHVTKYLCWVSSWASCLAYRTHCICKVVRSLYCQTLDSLWPDHTIHIWGSASRLCCIKRYW